MLTTLLLASLAGPTIQEAPLADPRELTRAHYASVLEELRAADTSGLSPARLTARTAAIEVLTAYRERGQFGISMDPRGNLPLFVDGQGRRCAVAELMHVTGNEDLVARLSGRDNNVWVPELTGDPEVAAWLTSNGFTLREAARIQAPAIGPPMVSEWTVILEAVPVPPLPKGPGKAGPPLAPSTPSPRSAPDAPATPAGGPATPTPPGPAAGTVVKTGPMTPIGQDAGALWWMWWEMNKTEYLQPNRFLPGVGPATGLLEAGQYPGTVLDAIRDEVAELLRADLSHDVAVVRAAAGTAYGRVAGEAAVEELRALLDDPSIYVRDSAILALGATASDQAAVLLRNLVASGSPEPRSRKSVSSSAQAYAVIALGLARNYGWNDPTIDAFLSRTREGTRGGERERFDLALLLHRDLVNATGQDVAASLGAIAHEMLESRKVDRAVRARAIEGLAKGAGTASLGRLADFTRDRDLESRRAAALGLGEHGSDMALPVLQTAFELEKEPFARGSILISIGRRGGVQAREFLIEELADGRRTMRPWAALGLGIVAGLDDDDLAREALRGAYGDEKNADARGAYLIAMGLARDAGAAPLLSSELLESRRGWTRTHAALGLALCGGEGARDVLRAALPLETDSLARVTIVQGLGLIGDDRDSEILVQLLADQRGADLQALAAVAAGLSGSGAVVDGLQGLVTDAHTAPGARAAAIDGLGVLLARQPGLALAELGHGSNFSVYPDWVNGLFRFTL